ncbi:MAG: Rne/Rng family ribonuclease [Bacteroidales bacterium]|nr:Rne/Rng family ribonuclease [Bacteroidales bacterium]
MKELIIDSASAEVVIALIENKQLVELHREKNDAKHVVGDVFLGRIKKIMPGLNAAFVDVGSEKEGFLHCLDLGQQIKALNRFTNCAINGDKQQLDISDYKLTEEFSKTAKITSFIKQNQQILVQVVKEPISTKGPRINSELSFPGRFLVLIPFSNKISVSQKIKSNEERRRLRSLITSIRPKNFGVIVRTVAEGQSIADLDSDLRSLFSKWEQISKNLHNAVAPVKVYGESIKSVSILRDILNDDFSQVVTNDVKIYDEIKNYVSKVAGDKRDIVKLHKGKEHIFDAYGISRQIKSSFGRVVPIQRGGAYLIIEHTEALHVIDVNSGHRVNSEQTQEQNAFDVNKEAAIEVAHQLRLRDIGGIVVVDFIDQRESGNRKALYEAMVDAMKNDPARHTILPPSKFGLIQITRQRVRPQTEVNVIETCPTCGGTGEVKPTILTADEIQKNIEYLVEDQNEKKFSIIMHPYVYSYFRRFPFKYKWKWYFKYGWKINIYESESLGLLEYRFLNKDGEEIQL